MTSKPYQKRHRQYSSLWHGSVHGPREGPHESVGYESGTYGPFPPVWQSAQFTCVRSPMSTGCWKPVCGGADADATAVVPSLCDSIVWH